MLGPKYSITSTMITWYKGIVRVTRISTNYRRSFRENYKVYRQNVDSISNSSREWQIDRIAEEHCQTYEAWMLAFLFYFFFFKPRVRVRMTRSHCHTSVTSDDMITVMGTSYETHKKCKRF